MWNLLLSQQGRTRKGRGKGIRGGFQRRAGDKGNEAQQPDTEGEDPVVLQENMKPNERRDQRSISKRTSTGEESQSSAEELTVTHSNTVTYVPGFCRRPEPSKASLGRMVSHRGATQMPMDS